MIQNILVLYKTNLTPFVFDGVESEVAFFNINGDTLLVAEEGPDGLVTDFELPFIRQSEFLLLSEPDVVVDPVSQSNDIFNR